MCVYLGEHELIKSIEEDLGESHALKRHRHRNVLGCLLIEVKPPIVDGCFVWTWRCHNDACPVNTTELGIVQCFAVRDFEGIYTSADMLLFKRALYTNHDFVFRELEEGGREKPVECYRFNGAGGEMVRCALCTRCLFHFEDDPAECALSKSKIL
jgi:hypothetical protein